MFLKNVLKLVGSSYQLADFWTDFLIETLVYRVLHEVL